MGALDNPLEQKLESWIKSAEKLRDTFTSRLATPGSLLDSYTQLLARLREISVYDPRKGEPNPKEFIKLANAVPLESRQAIAFRGPVDGVARSIMKYLPNLGLSEEDSLVSALLCILEDCEYSFPYLSSAKLSLDSEALVMLAALKNQSVLSFEDFKTQEVMYQTADTDNQREMAEIQRRFEQARGKKTQHIKKHILNYMPKEIKEQPSYCEIMISASLQRDTYGTLEVLRESASTENLRATADKLLDGISDEDKLDLLEFAAKLGLGLASNYLDLFIGSDALALSEKLKKIFRLDVTAGHSLFGVYAFEGMHHYPFELERFESVLPRRVTNLEANEYLKLRDANAPKPRNYTSIEIGETVEMLQDRDVRRFLESLRADVGRHWKTHVQEQKKNVVFGDLDLKVRNILFLVAYSLFEPEEKYEKIIEMIQKNHPILTIDPSKIYILANRYYFLDLLGLHVDFLFNRTQKIGGSTGTYIVDVSDYQARTLMHSGMSIYLRISDVIFKEMPIAWNMLIGQCDGKIDLVLQEINSLFDAFDVLLTILSSVIEDLPEWSRTNLLDALSKDAPSLSFTHGEAVSKQAQLRLTTMSIIARTREALHRYCVDALYYRSKLEKVTTINIIQVLKMSRNKTDKLRILIQNDPNKANRK